jgi:hypothetical protein
MSVRSTLPRAGAASVTRCRLNARSRSAGTSRSCPLAISWHNFIAAALKLGVVAARRHVHAHSDNDVLLSFRATVLANCNQVWPAVADVKHAAGVTTATNGRPVE